MFTDCPLQEDSLSFESCPRAVLTISNTFSPSPPAVSRIASGAAVDRYESDRQRHRAVFKFLDTTRDKRAEEESRTSITATTAGYSQEDEDEYYDEYYVDEYDDGMSGDYELPQGTDVRSGFCLTSLHPVLLSQQNVKCDCFSASFSCHVEQTQRPVRHLGG